MKVSMEVNGRAVSGDIEGRTLLVDFLREGLHLTGTHVGCDTSQCGACTVHIDGQATRSCITAVGDIAGLKVTTIEGLDADANHPVQEAWRNLRVPQCGYCQSGQIMQAASLLQDTPNPTDQDIDDVMTGNLCRCMTYPRIRQAVREAATAMSGAQNQ